MGVWCGWVDFGLDYRIQEKTLLYSFCIGINQFSVINKFVLKNEDCHGF